MKRKRELSDEEGDEYIPPKPKKRRFVLSSEENSISPQRNTNANSNNANKKKQTNLSSFFNVAAPSSSNTERKSSDLDSDSDSEEDEDYFITKWNCNQIRNKIRKLLSTKGFKITHWLKELNVNSNSYQRYMRLKGKWNNTSNQTYCAAHRYFMKQDKLKQKQKAKDKKKTASEKKKDAAKRKKERENKKKQVEDILKEIKRVEDEGYDEDAAIYDDCNDVRKGILLFLKREIMTKSRFLKEIGNVANNSYASFASMGPLKLSGAANRSYPLAYHWLEKLRIAEGGKKSKKRLQNEADYQDGFPLIHDNGRWFYYR